MVVLDVPDNITAQIVPPSPIVLNTEPDYYVTAQVAPPNDPFYSSQWALPVMNVPSAWPLLPNDTPTITVAVLDSGICANNSELAGRIIAGYDYVENDTVPQDEYGHGCAVSGVIAAITNNGIGVAGVAPNTQIMPVRVLDATGHGSYTNVAAGLAYAADHGAKIINLSLAGTVPADFLRDAVNYAVAKGALVIAAAGNSNGGPVRYPAAYPAAIAVGSVDSNLQPSSFSAVGPEIDTWAPGSNIEVITLGGGYGKIDGTSFAAPNVVGVAALSMALNLPLVLNGGIISVALPSNIPPQLAPANNATVNTNVTGSSITMTWNTTAILAADHYELQLAPLDDDLSGVTPIEISAPNNSYTAWLEFGSYHWRVRSVNIADAASDWSDIRTFSIATPAKAPPLLNIYTTDTPTFTWAAVSWASSYRVEISTSYVFTDSLAFSQSVDSTVHTVTSGSLEQGQYYWRVCAISGQTTSCSAAESFFVDLSSS